MKERVLFAAVAGLGLVSATQPAATGTAPADPTAYPACSRTVTDHCIQLYERGVRNPRHQARAAAAGNDEASEVMAADDHPGPAMAAGQTVPAAGTAPQRRVLAQRIRRAGERG